MILIYVYKPLPIIFRYPIELKHSKLSRNEIYE